jgi:pimeloyl-ACP methyl ester carboxylesterase
MRHSFRFDAETSLVYTLQGDFNQRLPILLVHGFMGTGQSEFMELVPWLGAKHPLLLPDLRGYGDSTPKPRPYELDFYRRDAESLAALIEHLALPRLAVLGYSDGGEVALWLPLLLPERITGVLTWGATGHFSPAIKPAILQTLHMAWRTPQIDALHGAEHIPLMTQRWAAAMLGLIEAGGDITYSRAHQMRCPVWMLVGEKDALNPVEQAQAMVYRLRRGRLFTYRGAGHALHQENPRVFRRHVERFLAHLGGWRRPFV